jgi:hypothetical protein
MWKRSGCREGCLTILVLGNIRSIDRRLPRMVLIIAYLTGSPNEKSKTIYRRDAETRRKAKAAKQGALNSFLAFTQFYVLDMS